MVLDSPLGHIDPAALIESLDVLSERLVIVDFERLARLVSRAKSVSYAGWHSHRFAGTDRQLVETLVVSAPNIDE